MLHTLLIAGLPMGVEWIIILVVALLIFGKRLPEVGKSLGKGIVEFKRGLKGVQDEVDEVSREVEDASSRPTPGAVAEPRKDPAKLQAYHTDTAEQRTEEHADQAAPPLANDPAKTQA